MSEYLTTWQWGKVRIVEESEIDVFAAIYLRDDCLGEWSYWKLDDSDEVVAVHNWEED